MELNSSHLDEAVACADPECAQRTGRALTAEPDQDGEHRFYECADCGYTFGYRKVDAEPAANPGGVCAVGIPEHLRRRASQAMQTAQARTQPPLLTIGRPPNAAAT